MTTMIDEVVHTIQTENSTYEIRGFPTELEVRRIGPTGPIFRFAVDGEWHRLNGYVRSGGRITFYWPDGSTTGTSRVVA